MAKKILVTAHTGCMGTKDNSVESFLAGVSSGVDIIEVDVRFTKQGVPVLSHDAFPDGTEDSLVKLSTIFELLSEHKDVMVNLDMKEKHELSVVGSMIHEAGLAARVFYTGIEPEWLDTVRRDSPGIRYLVNGEPDSAKITDPDYLSALVSAVINSGAMGINLHHRFITPEVVDAFHSAGSKVFIWTVDDEAGMKRMIELGVDSITTRNVDMLINILTEMGLR